MEKVREEEVSKSKIISSVPVMHFQGAYLEFFLSTQKMKMMYNNNCGDALCYFSTCSSCSLHHRCPVAVAVNLLVSAFTK